MSTINSSGTLTYSGGTSFTYTPNGGSPSSINFINPIIISENVTVTFGSDLTLTTLLQYFVIDGDHVTIDGAGYAVTVPTGYSGLVQNGSSSADGFNYCLFKNIGIKTVLNESLISGIARQYFGKNKTDNRISQCYVVCDVDISSSGGGIAGTNNSTDIINCFVICGGNISGGGIAGTNNSGSIDNCYVICGGNISSSSGGIAASGNSGTINNCYVICGGGIIGVSTPTPIGGGGIVGTNNNTTGNVSNCYVICCGNIGNIAGGIAGSSNLAKINNCYVNYQSLSPAPVPGYAIASLLGAGSSGNAYSSSLTPKWTTIGSSKLDSTAWINLDSVGNTPWVIGAFSTDIASSTTTTSISGNIDLNPYGDRFLNGSVYSGTSGATFAFDAGNHRIGYSYISYGTYRLGLFANQLIKNLSYEFTFTNPDKILSAFNSNASTPNDIVSFYYSVTDDVTLTYPIDVSGTLTYYTDTSTYTYTYSEGNQDIQSWPVSIDENITVTFGSDLTLTTPLQYFVIGGDHVTIDGAGYAVTVPTAPTGYSGLVENGSSSANGFNYCLFKNIGIKTAQNGNLISGIARQYFGKNKTDNRISQCYVVCDVDISSSGGGIAGTNNSTDIINCFVICGGNISGGGIAGTNNSGSIDNCYVICGGNISSSSGGIAASGNSGTINNCYVICGGGIIGVSTPTPIGGGGGIVGTDNKPTGNVSNCYVICCGNIGNNAGGIAGFSNLARINNCYVNYQSLSPAPFPGSEFASNLVAGSSGNDHSPSPTPKWTNDGATYLTSLGWTNIDPTNNKTPWVLSAFDTAIASSTTTNSSSGMIPLNTYGHSFTNGTVYSGTQRATFTYLAGTAIAYSDVSFVTSRYVLGLFAYELLSNLTDNLTPFTFAFTNDSAIQTAFNYSGSSANNIVPYSYSVTNNVTLTYPIISGICFQEKTPIQTDQGIIPIEKIDSDVNTINNKKIVTITKTISQDKYLVCFEKDSLGVNYPTKSTTVSKQHKILYRGKLIEAEKFLGHFADVKKAKYSGEVLYNVLMEKHEVVRANNLLCETLHPQNIIAKLYNSCMSESYKSKLTSLINESILKNDHTSYKKIVSRL